MSRANAINGSSDAVGIRVRILRRFWRGLTLKAMPKPEPAFWSWYLYVHSMSRVLGPILLFLLFPAAALFEFATTGAVRIEATPPFLIVGALWLGSGLAVYLAGGPEPRAGEAPARVSNQEAKHALLWLLAIGVVVGLIRLAIHLSHGV